MIKIGMPTLIELESLDDNIKLCKDLGLDFIEINMNFPQYQLDKLDGDYLKGLMDRHGLFFTFHLAEDIDVGHLNKRMRHAYIEEILDLLKLMDKIGSTVLNMHMSKGIFVTLPDKKVHIYEEYENDYLANIQAFITTVSELKPNETINIYVENTGIYDKNYIRKSVNKIITYPGFKLTWDIGHDHSSGHKDRDFLLANSHKIAHYHIHDALGSNNHLTLYDGEIDINGFIDRANNSNATVVFETKTIEALTTSVKRFKEKWKNIS